MANAINTTKSLTSISAKMGAVMLRNALGFTSSVDAEDEATFGQNFKSVQPGDTIYVNKQPRYTVRTNATFSAQDVTEEKVALTVDQRRGVDIKLTSAEIATDAALKNWGERFIKPAVSRIAEEVEKYNLQLAAQAAYQMVGTAGTSPATSGVFLQARERIISQACLDNGLMAVIPPSVNTTMVPALQGLFHADQQVSNQYRNGYLGKTTLGLDFMTSNLMYSHTNGTMAGAASALVNGAISTNGTAAIAIDGMTGSATITKGTVFTVAGVYDVNPVTKATLPNLKQFVVTADATLSAGAGSLSVSPAMYFSGTLQNVSATIADNAALTFTSGTGASLTYGQSLVYHPSAVRFCSVPLFDPGPGVVEAATETVDGISMRAIKFYDGATDELKMRLDIQFGTAIVRPEHLCRVTS